MPSPAPAGCRCPVSVWQRQPAVISQRRCGPARARSGSVPEARPLDTEPTHANAWQRCSQAPRSRWSPPPRRTSPARAPASSTRRGRPRIHSCPQRSPQLCAQRDLSVTPAVQTRWARGRRRCPPVVENTVEAEPSSMHSGLVTNGCKPDKSRGLFHTQLWKRVDDVRAVADNSGPACGDAVHPPIPSTAGSGHARRSHTRRTHPHRDADLPRLELSTGSTAPMTMTRPKSRR